jgi:hypothetical protein
MNHPLPAPDSACVYLVIVILPLELATDGAGGELGRVRIGKEALDILLQLGNREPNTSVDCTSARTRTDTRPTHHR